MKASQMNNLDPLNFSQLLASRICHDLISPVSAVNNGIELLHEEEDSEAHKQALELIEDSAKITALKLKLMRAAFGAGQSLPNNNSVPELLSLLQPIAEKNKIQILWDNQHSLDKTQSRIMLNLILILLESLPRGGMIEVSQDPDLNIALSVQSHKLIFSDDKVAYLNKSIEIPFEPRYIGFIILQFLAPNMQFDIIKSENALKITFKM